jgi:hypothetical protein
LKVRWLGPDGKEQESKHYKWLEAVRLPALAQTNFVTIQPGGVRYLGPSGDSSGILFQAQASPRANLAQSGKHTITASYSSATNGKEFGLEIVWTGTVTANEIVLAVK